MDKKYGCAIFLFLVVLCSAYAGPDGSEGEYEEVAILKITPYPPPCKASSEKKTVIILSELYRSISGAEVLVFFADGKTHVCKTDAMGFIHFRSSAAIQKIVIVRSGTQVDYTKKNSRYKKIQNFLDGDCLTLLVDVLRGSARLIDVSMLPSDNYVIILSSGDFNVSG